VLVAGSPNASGDDYRKGTRNDNRVLRRQTRTGSVTGGRRSRGEPVTRTFPSLETPSSADSTSTKNP
jgi:hypothetical protein